MQSTAPIQPPISCHRLPILRRNDRQSQPDESVKFLQQRLNFSGFNLRVDGFFGSRTEAAVREFQARGNDHNPSILVDGIVGPQTWNALGVCEIYTEGCC